MEKPGSEIDHLAHQALTTGGADTTWLAMRNAYFRAGTPEEAWNHMAEAFAARGCKISSESRPDKSGKPIIWVHLQPA